MGRPCEDSLGLIRGLEVQELVKRATGEDCPCIQGDECPLLCSTSKRPELVVPPARSDSDAPHGSKAKSTLGAFGIVAFGINPWVTTSTIAEQFARL